MDVSLDALLSLLWMFTLMPYLHIQVLGLLVEVEVMKKRFQKHINNVLQVTKRILQSAIDAVTHDSPHETAIPFWKEAFYSLVMLEKILNRFHDLCFDRDLEVCRIITNVEAIFNFLLGLCIYFRLMGEWEGDYSMSSNWALLQIID